MKSSLPVLALLCALSARAQTNPIARENALPGAPESEWTITGLNQATAHEIEGYPWPLSVSAGRAITLYVNSTYALNKISVYRLGWYQGLGARRVFGEATFSGIAQPPPRIDPATGLVDCSTWLPSFTFGTSTNGVPWPSGVYLAKLSGAGQNARQRHVLFVVRHDGAPSPILFLTAFNTYHAYNTWGFYDASRTGFEGGWGHNARGEGYSLYGMPYRQTDGGVAPFGASLSCHSIYGDSSICSRPRGIEVSFRRPIAGVVKDGGLGDRGAAFQFLKTEYPLLRFLEEKGFDVSYAADVDLDARPPISLLNHRAVVVAGHSEYWTMGMRNALEQARDRFVNLALLASNSGYWQVRYEHDDAGLPVHMRSYKESATGYCANGACATSYTGFPGDAVPGSVNGDPYRNDLISGHAALVTKRFRDLGRPEGALFGVQYVSGTGTFSGVVKASPATLRLDPLFHGTGLRFGTAFPNVFGWEVDEYDGAIAPSPRCIHHLVRAPHGSNASRDGEMVLYRLPNNTSGTVFSAGTMLWGLALSDWGSRHPEFTANNVIYPTGPEQFAARRMTQNLFEWFTLPADTSRQQGCYLPRSVRGAPTKQDLRKGGTPTRHGVHQRGR